MTLIDIDDRAAKARLQEISAANKAAFDVHTQRVAQLASEERAALERDEAELKAAQERKAEAEAAAARKAAEQEKEQQAEEPKSRPKPSTLSLGADEFKEARQARKAVDDAAEVKPAEAPKPPSPVEEPPRPGKTLKLGARDEEEATPKPNRTMKLGARDDDEPKPEERPVRRPRPPRPEGDDDMSGRTWLR